METPNYTTNSDMLTLLAKRVKEYRLAARMSQKELAEQSGVSQTTISHFEQGVSRNLNELGGARNDRKSRCNPMG